MPLGRLIEAGLVEEIAPGLHYVADSEQYSVEVGLMLRSHWLDETIMC